MQNEQLRKQQIAALNDRIQALVKLRQRADHWTKKATGLSRNLSQADKEKPQDFFLPLRDLIKEAEAHGISPDVLAVESYEIRTYHLSYLKSLKAYEDAPSYIVDSQSLSFQRKRQRSKFFCTTDRAAQIFDAYSKAIKKECKRLEESRDELAKSKQKA